MTDTWTPSYSRWRHGGWYVNNIRYASGACGCVSNNYDDKKWRIVCGDENVTFSTRDEAARAEKKLADEAQALEADVERKLDELEERAQNCDGVFPLDEDTYMDEFGDLDEDLCQAKELLQEWRAKYPNFSQWRTPKP